MTTLTPLRADTAIVGLRIQLEENGKAVKLASLSGAEAVVRAIEFEVAADGIDLIGRGSWCGS